MKAINPIFGTSALLLLLTACQSAQTYDGQSGYRLESNNDQQIVISYVMDAKSSTTSTQHKLQSACAKELGLSTSQVKFKTLYEKEFVNPNPKVSMTEQSGVPFGSSQHTTFGLSSTPKLSNTEHVSNNYMLESKPTMLRQVTVQCMK